MEKNLGGIRDMESLPEALFVIDTNHEHIAVPRPTASASRSWRSSTPTATPTCVDFPIPGNDDAIRAIKLFTSRIADSVLEGWPWSRAAARPRRARASARAAVEVAAEGRRSPRRSRKRRLPSLEETFEEYDEETEQYEKC